MARAIASAAASAPGVASLGSGPSEGFATYGPHETVEGVAIRRTTNGAIASIAIVAEYQPDRSLIELAGKVRRRALRAAAEVAAGGVDAVDVTIQDLLNPTGRNT